MLLSFQEDDALQYGVDEAIVLSVFNNPQAIAHSDDEFINLFPFWEKEKVLKLVGSLHSKGLLQ